MILPAAIVKVAPAAKLYADELVRQMAESGIMANPLRASMFLGQVEVESAGFKAVVENLNYSEKRIRKMAAQSPQGSRWRSLGPRAGELARNPRALAEAAYGGRMGNGPEGSGDGWAFRGRGLKQLTSRPNYRAFSLAWLGDESLLTYPDRVAEPDGAVASAIWFWVSNDLNDLADKGSVKEVTKRVNGGLNGLAERIKATEQYRQLWRDDADFRKVTQTVTSTEDPL